MMKQRYDFDLIYTPGKHIVLADALSSAPTVCHVSSTGDDVEVHVSMITATLPVSDTKSRQISEQTAKDTELLYRTFIQVGSMSGNAHKDS